MLTGIVRKSAHSGERKKERKIERKKEEEVKANRTNHFSMIRI